MSLLAPLLDEAWEHRRRRWRRWASIVLLGATVAVVVLALVPSGRHPGVRSAGRSVGRPAAGTAPGRVLAGSPYLGVNCRVANSIACDRVGLAVSLKRPALSVSATIAGRPLALTDRGDLPATSSRPRRAFTGFLRPAGIVSRLHVRPVQGAVVVRRHGRWTVHRLRMWLGDVQQPWPTPRVTLTIRYPGGDTVHTRLRVALSTGWG